MHLEQYDVSAYHCQGPCSGGNINTLFEKENLAQVNQGSLHTLHGADGLQAQFSTFGGALRTLFVPDRQGSLINVVLGYSEEADYVQDTNFIAGVIGRYANRIYRGRLPIRGAEHRLAVNDGPHQLHGGRPGFHKVLWKVRVLDAHSIELAY